MCCVECDRMDAPWDQNVSDTYNVTTLMHIPEIMVQDVARGRTVFSPFPHSAHVSCLKELLLLLSTRSKSSL